MTDFRAFCAGIGRMSNGQWQALLAERATLRTEVGVCEEHGVERGAKGECYRNATIEALHRDDVVYVQGYATTSFGFPIAHGWLETRDGLVLDPTWEDGQAYFGVAIEDELLRDVLGRHKFYGATDNQLIEELREA